MVLLKWGEMFGLEDRDIVHNAGCIQIERPGVGKAYMRRPPWLFPEIKATYEICSGVASKRRDPDPVKTDCVCSDNRYNTSTKPQARSSTIETCRCGSWLTLLRATVRSGVGLDIQEQCGNDMKESH